MEDLQRLVIIEEIRKLRSRYWRYLDTQQWDKFATLFTDDCVFDASLDAFTPPPGGRAIADTLAEVFAGVTSVHHGMQHEIEVLDGTHARGIWTMADYVRYPPGASHAHESSETAFYRGYGHYVDDYEKVGDEWLFSHVELYRIHRELTNYAKSEVPEALKR
jgi:hypothetical protein